MSTVAVAKQKGGVEKTIIAYNLYQMSAWRHNIVMLIVDNDSQNLTITLKRWFL